jgi:DNA-binding transcriptional ArsR family regulator
VRNLSLPAIHKHVKILEAAGMVTRRKVRQTNVLTLNPASLRVLQDWVAQYHPYWGSGKETLENYAHYLGKRRNDTSEEKP